MGRAPCCDKASVKKGPWSPEEDRKLKEYIHKYGTGGNWIALPHKAGLKRCGKSCRLRWLNYLRPNIKHGDFTDDEDRIICSLFAAIGSRWSIIAAHLPGRTDNDIKNYWNTKLKKKLMHAHGLQPPTTNRHHSHHSSKKQQHLFFSAEASLSSLAPPPVEDPCLSLQQYLATDPVHNLPSHQHYSSHGQKDNNVSTFSLLSAGSSELLMFGGNGGEHQPQMMSSTSFDTGGGGLGFYFELCSNNGGSHGHGDGGAVDAAAGLAMESFVLQDDDDGQHKAPLLLAGAAASLDHQYGGHQPVGGGGGGNGASGYSFFYDYCEGKSSSSPAACVSQQGSFMY